MNVYLVSMATGILIGVIYALLGVRSPAPPIVALLGLLGMLFGEVLVPVGKRVVRGEPLTTAWFVQECVPKIMGGPPAEVVSPARKETLER